MLFMVIERYRDQDAATIYGRFKDKGRLAPEGLKVVHSWVEANFDRCFLLIECDDPRDMQRWVMGWRDLVTFEFCPVVPSKDTVATVEPFLTSD